MITNQTIRELINQKFNPIYTKANSISNSLSPTTSVIHRTDIKNLPNIMSEGLKIEKSVTPTGATEIIEISKRIKKELDKPQDRYKSIYATFNDIEITDSYINELQSRQEALIEFKVYNNDPDIFVANFIPIDRAIFDQMDFNRTKNHQYLRDMKRNLYEYWESFVPLYDYLNKEQKYYCPEILIFHDIEPTILNILSK